MPANRTAATRSLITFGAAGACLGGGLRIVSSFIPWTPASPWLESLYGVIDLGLLFGLIGVYLSVAEAIGRLGLAFFVLSLSAQASLVGPEANLFGIDFCQLGAAGVLLGLGCLALKMVQARVKRIPAGPWLASALIGFGSTALHSAIGILVCGVILGLGFVVAGGVILQTRGPSPTPA